MGKQDRHDWKSVSELLKNDSKLRDLVNEDIEVAVSNIYQNYFRDTLEFSDDAARVEAQKALRDGILIAADAGDGKITARWDAYWFTADNYFLFLVHRVSNVQGRILDYLEAIPCADDEDKKVAERGVSILLSEMVLAHYLELEGGLFETQLLAGSKFQKILSDAPDFSVRSEIELVNRLTEKRRKRHAGVRRGGARGRKGFSWDDATKVAFYKMVDRTPKVKNKPIWDFACEELIEQEFDSETQRWILSRPQFEGVDSQLFAEAIKRWRKYDEARAVVSHADRPRFFQYRQALINLNIPDRFTYSTLDTYYYEGKKLSDDQKLI